MDEVDRSVQREVEGMHPRVDPGGEATLRNTRSRGRARRRPAVVVGLAVSVLAFGVACSAFRPSAGEPQSEAPTPIPTHPVAARPCDWLGTGVVPDEYSQSARVLEGDVDGDDMIDRIEVLTDEARPEACRFVLRVETGSGSELAAAIAPLEWPGTAPEPLILAELDGRAGVEVVIDISPAAVYRPGAVFTMQDGELVRVALQGAEPADLFPLDDEFPAGVDCTRDSGTIVVTFGTLADGGNDDSRWEITRTTYRAVGAAFEPLGSRTHVVDVGSEMERWPELRGEPFRSCPFVVG